MTPCRDLARRRAGALFVGFALFVGACSTSSTAAPTTSLSASTAVNRPPTPATLQIVTPAPNVVTGRRVVLQLRLAHASLVPPGQVGGTIRPDRGHIHVSVDGSLVSMTLRIDQAIPALAPGVHTIEAEFVASDHLPFKNRVVAAVTFRVA